jgi:N-acetyl-anhydromuramyl-L-alanine amidase AmpD
MSVAHVVLPPIYWAPSPNQSTRREKISGVVMHETEGAFAGAVSWLRNPQAQASAHIVLKEDGSQAAQLVSWSAKAWHAVNANSHTIGLELAGKTAETNNPAQIARAARIVAFWCHRFGIPPKQGDAHGYNGIVRHRDLGTYGGGHHDPGGFDWEAFIAQVGRELHRGHFRPSWGRD